MHIFTMRFPRATKYKIQNPALHLFRVTVFWTLTNHFKSSFPIDAGYWLLDTGYWVSGTGYPAVASQKAGSSLRFDGLRVVPLKRDFRFATTSFELRVASVFSVSSTRSLVLFTPHNTFTFRLRKQIHMRAGQKTSYITKFSVTSEILCFTPFGTRTITPGSNEKFPVPSTHITALPLSG